MSRMVYEMSNKAVYQMLGVVQSARSARDGQERQEMSYSISDCGVGVGSCGALWVLFMPIMPIVPCGECGVCGTRFIQTMEGVKDNGLL